jgi:3-oxoacyl-[acyl-carrier protein] reductase
VDLGLSGRRALITAASKGLGKACALALAQEGAHVFIAARGAGELEKASTEVRAAGRMAADVSDRLVPQRLVDAAATAMGGLDILVSNAGGPPPGTFLGTELEAWDKGYQLTLMSFVRLVKAALPYLDQSDQARIVILTSTSVREPNPNIVLSNAFRSAVTSAAKTLSVELMPKGITVNTLQPGRILTDRILELDSSVAAREGITREAVTERSVRAIPAGRLGRVEEFGAACAFLCSKHASYITGQNLAIDGGMLKGVH